MPRFEIINQASVVRVSESSESVTVDIVERPMFISQQVTGLQGPAGPQGTPGIDSTLVDALNDPPDMTLLFENGLV